MNRFYLYLLCLFAGWMTAAFAVGAEPAAPASLEAADDVTVITSTRLTFDYKKKYALFEEQVVVMDPQMQMTADRLTVHFDEAGKATAIKAEGNVKLTQSDKTAQAQVASYDVESGKIVLAGSPRVMRGRDILEGDVITFWRDENRMIVQPQARLLIYPDKEGSKDQLFGE